MIMDDYDSQMIFGETWGHKASWHLSCRWGKTAKKNLTEENRPDRDANPGSLRDRCACYRLLHSGGDVLWWLWWPMISGDRLGLRFSDICLTLEEKFRKNPQQGKLTRPGIEPGPARWEATILPLDHSGDQRLNKECKLLRRMSIKSRYHNNQLLFRNHMA